jgi:hypothetical protein
VEQDGNAAVFNAAFSQRFLKKLVADAQTGTSTPVPSPSPGGKR